MKTQRGLNPGVLGFLSLPIAFGIALAIAACTDGRRARGVPLIPQQGTVSSNLIFASSVRFDDKPTQVLQMRMEGTSLFLSGFEFGFMRLDIGANPEAPNMIFNQHDMIDVFAPSGWPWRPDWYASGALAITGQLAILSGDKGTSVVSLLQTTDPREVARFPGYNNDLGRPNSDTAFQYAAIVTNGDMFYGFRRSDYVYTVQIQQNGLNLVRRDAYNGGNVYCCVTSGTTYGGAVYIAFTDSIAIFDVGADRMLANPQRFDALQATYIASSPRYIYVQHSPNYTNTAGQQYPRGIYAFDQTGRNVGFFPHSFKSFAVGPGDRTLYANRDDQSVEIYRMLWQ